MKQFGLCLPAIFPAIFLGRKLNRRLKGGAFFKYIYMGLIVISLLLIVFAENTINR